jgi:hypothetical protein
MQPPTRRLLWTATAVLLLAARAAARDIYVDNLGGDDRFTGRHVRSTPDLTGPVRTIGKALRLAQSGDRIVLADTGVPYRESIALAGSRHSGSAVGPFVIQGNGAILDGSAPVPPTAWRHYEGAVFRFRPPAAGYQQLFLDDRPLERVPVPAAAQRPPKLEPLQWCFVGGEIYFCVEPARLPDEYDLSYTHHQTGVTLYHVENVAIVDLVVQGFRIDGIHAANSARRVYLAGVTCRGNGRSGIAVGGASSVEIEVSLLGNNGAAQLLTLPHSQTQIRNSLLLSHGAPAWVDRGGRLWLDDERIEGGREEIAPPGERPEAAGARS